MIPTIVWTLPRPAVSRYKGGFPVLRAEPRPAPRLPGADPASVRRHGRARNAGGPRPALAPDVVADAHELPFEDESFDCVVLDPPYSDEEALELYAAPPFGRASTPARPCGSCEGRLARRLRGPGASSAGLLQPRLRIVVVLGLTIGRVSAASSKSESRGCRSTGQRPARPRTSMARSERACGGAEPLRTPRWSSDRAAPHRARAGRGPRPFGRTPSSTGSRPAGCPASGSAAARAGLSASGSPRSRSCLSRGGRRRTPREGKCQRSHRSARPE